MREMSIRPSPELEAIALRWLKAISDIDATTIANLYSRSEATRYIGTDTGEWWSGRDVGTVAGHHVDEVFREGVRMVIHLDETEVEAYENGSSGWASLVSAVEFADREAAPFRFTLVFVLEDGLWRIVQSHNSKAAQNTEIMGVQLTTGLSELLETMGDTQDDLRASFSEGTVTLMFTDIEDSSSLAARLGDEAWVEKLGRHDTVIREIVEAHSGLVVKTLGDGAMAAFDSTRLGARAAVEIQKAFADGEFDLKVRIGLHVGDVVQTGDDYLGHAVNKAARVTSAAGGGEIMVSQAVSALLADVPEFEFGTPLDTELKGLPGIHQVVQLGGT